MGGVKGTKNALVVRGTSSDFNVYQRRRFVCVRWGGAKREIITAALVLKCTLSNSLTCINIVIFVGVGKMNVNPRFSLKGTSSNLLTCINVFFLFYRYIVR